MSLEAGGRSDKRGNTYEGRYLARLLLRLISEEISAVVVEPVGEDTDAFEYYTIDPNNKKTYYQCKASNGSIDHWRPSDLQRYNVFSRSKKLLFEEPFCEYKFVSPRYYGELDELCNRARTCSRPEDILEALSNQDLRTSFIACEKYYNLHRENPAELQQLTYILSHCEFLVIPDNSNSIEDLTQLVSLYFIGNPNETRVLLENFIDDTMLYGIKITAPQLIAFLKNYGVFPRDIRFDSRIAPAIERINENFRSAYNAISGSLFHRDCTDEIIQHIGEGKSIIVHGKAGTGKSGCMNELVQYLSSKEIPFLAVRLDKHTPSEFADKYGKALGLEESPVFCLNRIAAGGKCVLLLDQLDSLRWTAANSSTALDVCKEMIKQARSINEHQDGHISIVFCSRTFDLENDSGIKALFERDNKHLPWVKVKVDILENGEVRRIVGADYDALSNRVKELLRTPSSLYVWTKLSPDRQNNFASPQQLISAWWTQILDSSECHIQSKNDIKMCVDKMVSYMSQRSCFSLPFFLFQNDNKEVEYLASSGLIIRSNDTIAFAHQSILDMFLISKDLDFIYDGGSLLEAVINWGKQTPDKKYRFSALMQNLIDSDSTFFIREAEPILNSGQIHFYFKCTIFEILGQFQTPGDAVFRLIDEFYGKPEWHKFIKNTVFTHHAVYLQHLDASIEYDWMSEEGLSLLWTVRDSAPSFVVNILRRSISSSGLNIEKALSLLNDCIDKEPEELFRLRLELYETNTEFLGRLQFINVAEATPAHITTILKLFVSHSELYDKTHIYLDPREKMEGFIQKNFRFILSELFEVVCEKGNAVPISLHLWGRYHHEEWYPQQYDQCIIRDIVNLVKMSLNKLAEVDPEEALRYISLSGNNKNAITNELVLSALAVLSTDYSDAAIRWVLSDFDTNIVDCTSNEQDFLGSCKKVIKKHSPFCSEELFRLLEEKICNWCDDREIIIERYRGRIDYIRQNKDTEPVYWAFWGSLQKALLPMLDEERTSKKAKELLSVLNRNSWVKASDYYSGITSGSMRHVVSPIHDRMEKLSDKTWLAIASSKIDERHGRWSEKADEQYCYETSHRMFASDMSTCTAQDPERFAKLSLKFPENIDPSYISSVLFALGNDTSIMVGFSLLCQVIRRYMICAPENIAMNILRIIGIRANEAWPEDILRYIAEIASGNMKPEGNEYVIMADDSEEILPPSSLENNAINLPRSEAVYTMANLLDEHPSLTAFFKPVLEMLSKDESDVVRYALVQCAVSSYQHDPGFATEIFDTLVKQDLRVIAARNAFWLMSINENTLVEKYFVFIKKACDSPSSELAKKAVRLVCATAIYTANAEVLAFLFEKDWSRELLDVICDEVIYAFEIENYRQTSQQILNAA